VKNKAKSHDNEPEQPEDMTRKAILENAKEEEDKESVMKDLAKSK